MNSKPKCPRCGRRKSVRPVGDLLHCGKCSIHFDDDPDEGGSYSDRNPAARMERAERSRQRRTQPRRM